MIGSGKHFAQLTPGPKTLDQQKHGHSQRSASEQETAVEVGKVLEHRNCTVAGAKQGGAAPEEGRAREQPEKLRCCHHPVQRPCRSAAWLESVSKTTHCDGELGNRASPSAADREVERDAEHDHQQHGDDGRRDADDGPP